jgi:DNA-binding transcriptional regulator YdaS (Cro superfamily)
MGHPLKRAIEIIGTDTKVAEKLGVSPQRLHNWKTRKLPKTELTGETDFAGILERETRRKVRKVELLEWSFPHLVRAA